MNIANVSYIPQANKLNVCKFLYRQHRSVTATFKNIVGHSNYSTVVKYTYSYVKYRLNKYFIYITNIQYILEL